jgi:hypothetical protein
MRNEKNLNGFKNWNWFALNWYKRQISKDSKILNDFFALNNTSSNNTDNIIEIQKLNKV